MSTFKKDTLINSGARFDTYSREPHLHIERNYDQESKEWSHVKHEDVTELTYGEQLHCEGRYGTYYMGSVVGYALQYNECPIKAVERAKKNGHNLHWIGANAAMITAHDVPKEKLIQVRIGMKVRFEGLIATIEKAPNNNLQLVPVEAPVEA